MDRALDCVDQARCCFAPTPRLHALHGVITDLTIIMSSAYEHPPPRNELDSEVVKHSVSAKGHADVSTIRTLVLQRKKLTHLGNGLVGFACLVKLDLSRNSLVSLSGLEQCSALSTLILYYNRLSALAEVQKLGKLKLLRDLDLRLNPFTQEDHYRHYVVYFAPFIARLDEREVGPSERRVAEDVLLDLDLLAPPDVARSSDYNLSPNHGRSNVLNHRRATQRNAVELDGHDGKEDIDLVFESSNTRKQHGGIQSPPSADETDKVLIPGRSTLLRRTDNRDASSLYEDESDVGEYSHHTSAKSPTKSTAGSPSTRREKVRIEEHIDDIVDQLDGAIAEVVLPHRLSMNPQTIVHVPSVVARVAKPVIRDVIRRVIFRHNRQTREHVDRMERFRDEFAGYERQLKANEDASMQLKQALAGKEEENANLQRQLKEMREQLQGQEKKFLAERAELASADIVNSCLESVNMLREAHRALMSNNSELRGELEKANVRYRTEEVRWKKNFEELRVVYESRLEHEAKAHALTKRAMAQAQVQLPAPLTDSTMVDLAHTSAAATIVDGTTDVQNTGASPARSHVNSHEFGLRVSSPKSAESRRHTRSKSNTFRIPGENADEYIDAAVAETSLMATKKIEQYMTATRYVSSPTTVANASGDGIVWENPGADAVTTTENSGGLEKDKEGLRAEETRAAALNASDLLDESTLSNSRATSPRKTDDEVLEAGEWAATLSLAAKHMKSPTH